MDANHKLFETLSLRHNQITVRLSDAIEAALTRYFNGLNVRFLRFYFWHYDRQNPIFHRDLNFVHLHILRQPEPPQKLATAVFNPMPINGLTVGPREEPPKIFKIF